MNLNDLHLLVENDKVKIEKEGQKTFLHGVYYDGRKCIWQTYYKNRKRKEGEQNECIEEFNKMETKEKEGKCLS